MRSDERQLALNISEYLQYQYKDCIWHHDIASDLKLPIWIAARNRKLNPLNGYPDLFIAEPRGKYAGLYIELKKDKKTAYKANGELRDNEHIQAQRKVLERLWQKGYQAAFGCGFEDCKEIIDTYLQI